MKLREKPDFSRLPILAGTWIPWRLARRWIAIDDGQVRVTDRGVIRARPFMAPLSTFAGVRRSAGMSHGKPVFRIELVQDETGVRFPLFQSNDEGLARTAWLEVARATGLAAIDESPAGSIIRQGIELERPFRAVLGGGVPAVLPERPPGPSWPLRWRVAGEAHAKPPWPDGTSDVSLPMVGPGILATFAVLIGLSGFLCLHGFPGGMVEMLEAVRMLYCVQAALLSAILLLMLGERRHIAVTRRSVTLCSTWFGRRRRGGVTLPLDAVDTVIHPARQLALGAGSMLIVAAGAAGFTIADLSARQARWIGRFVMAAAMGEGWVYDGVPAQAAPNARADAAATTRRACAA